MTATDFLFLGGGVCIALSPVATLLVLLADFRGIELAPGSAAFPVILSLAGIAAMLAGLITWLAALVS